MAVTLFRSAQGTISRPSPRHLSFSCIRGCLFRSNKGSPRDMDANSALVIESAQNSRGASIADKNTTSAWQSPSSPSLMICSPGRKETSFMASLRTRAKTCQIKSTLMAITKIWYWVMKSIVFWSWGELQNHTEVFLWKGRKHKRPEVANAKDLTSWNWKLKLRVFKLFWVHLERIRCNLSDCSFQERWFYYLKRHQNLKFSRQCDSGSCSCCPQSLHAAADQKASSDSTNLRWKGYRNEGYAVLKHASPQCTDANNKTLPWKKKTLWVFTWWKCLWFWQWELETVNGTRNHRLQRSQKLAACGTKSKGYELSLHKKKGTIGTLCSFVWEGQPNKLRIWTVWWNWKAWNGESTCQSGNERQALGEDVWFQHWSKQTLHGYL